MSHKKYRIATNCLNCGAEVTGKFCSNCGQENLETRENFFHLAFHFISDYFHFDSKFFRSLIPLFIKPGFLTKEYWEGRRASYIHPLRIFFFIAILFMIAANYFYNNYSKKVTDSFINQTVITTPNEQVKDSVARSKIDADDLVQAERIKKRFAVGIDSFFHNLNYVSFLLLPVYALIFQLLYFRRKTFYVDHLVYMLHLQTFAYCLLAFMFLLSFQFPDWMGVFRRTVIFIVFLYTIFSLRFLYNQSWWKTILKSVIATALLVFSTSTAFAIYLVIDYFVHK